MRWGGDPGQGVTRDMKEDRILRWALIAVFAIGVLFIAFWVIGQMAPFMNH
jgi:hypothetical protein